MTSPLALCTMTRNDEERGTLRLFWLCLMLLTLAGCQSFPHLEDSRLHDEQTFRHLWRLYSHCRSSEDLEEMREDIGHLRQAAQRYREPNKATFLQQTIPHVVEELPSRISVDPEAMMAACALHAGHVARINERSDIASKFYRLIVFGSWKSLPTYYVEEAHSGLALLERTTQLASTNTDATVLRPLD